MKKIELRYQRASDAKRFYEILNNPKFVYFESKPKSIKEERKFLEKNIEKRKKNFEHNFTIFYDGKAVGGAGIKIDQHRKFIGEIGFFVDENYWGRGIASKTAKLLEKICFNKLKLKRLEILIDQKNKASIRVAVKNRYKKEGLLRKKVLIRKKYMDAVLFAKVR